MDVVVTTASWGSENGLAIDGAEIAAQGSMGSNQEYTYTVCLADGEHTLTQIDSFGDGWHGGYVTIGGVVYDGFSSGTSMSFTFSVGAPCVTTDLIVTTATWASECSMQVDGVEVVAQGSLSNYGSFTYTTDCLAVGTEVSVTLIDSFGDGWHGG